MSVINKMLRDLDARRADGALPDLAREVRSAAMQGTVSVGGTGRRSARRWLLLPLLLLAAAAAWYWTTPTPAPTPVPPAVVPPPLAAQVPQGPASVPAAGPEAAAAPLQTAAPEPVEEAPRPTRAQRKAASKPEPAVTARTGKEKKPSVRPDDEPAARMTTAPGPVTTPPAASAAAPVLPPPAPRRQPAVQETLAQAQTLWAAGSYDPAVALLREAVVVAEGSPEAQAQLPAVARELARMEMALGRSGAALDLLTRLEPRLAGHADLWAMRGNAAQRLGRHAESVQAYQRALQLRPGEQRWLLGAAVSLAALGQAEQAAQYAEQARALGPVSAEVLAYLRQAGVPLR